MNNLFAKTSEKILQAFEAKDGLIARVILTFIFIFFTFTIFIRFENNAIETDLWSLLPEEIFDGAPKHVEKLWRQKIETQGNDLITVILTPEKDIPKEKYIEIKKAFLSKISSLVEVKKNSPTKDLKELGKLSLLARTEDIEKVRNALKSKDATKLLTQQVYSCILNPTTPKLLSVKSDPFCWFDKWAIDLSANSPFEEAYVGSEYFVLLKSQQNLPKSLLILLEDKNSIASRGSGEISKILSEATAYAQAITPIKSLIAGVPIFTDAISQKAQSELSMIGTISLIGVSFLAITIFGKISTVFTILFTVGLGLLAAFGSAWAIFPKLNLITFIFGATLIGLGVDYGTHWFLGVTQNKDPATRRKVLFPSLASAAATSACAYALLLFTPMPSLVEMGTVAACGIVGTFLSVVIFLPKLEKFAAPTKDTKILKKLIKLLENYPRVSFNKAFAISCIILFCFIVWGISKVSFSSGTSDLQSAPSNLITNQKEVENRLKLSSPAQFFLIKANDFEGLLKKENELKQHLSLYDDISIRLYGLSNFIADENQTLERSQLLSRAIDVINPIISNQFGDSLNKVKFEAVTVEKINKTNLKELFDQYYLGKIDNNEYSIVKISGIRKKDLTTLKNLALSVSGISFIDITHALESTLDTYRDIVLWSIVTGIVLLFMILATIIKGKAFRALMPVVIAIAFDIAFFGVMGMPITIFTALGLVLLLGLGIDYGLFLVARPNDARTSVAIFFSGVTTILSFGLLSLSSTPALATFGWTILIGETVVLILAPLFRS